MALLEADVSFKVVKQFMKGTGKSHWTGCNVWFESGTDGNQNRK